MPLPACSTLGDRAQKDNVRQELARTRRSTSGARARQPTSLQQPVISMVHTGVLLACMLPDAAIFSMRMG